MGCGHVVRSGHVVAIRVHVVGCGHVVGSRLTCQPYNVYGVSCSLAFTSATWRPSSYLAPVKPVRLRSVRFCEQARGQAHH